MQGIELIYDIYYWTFRVSAFALTFIAYSYFRKSKTGSSLLIFIGSLLILVGNMVEVISWHAVSAEELAYSVWYKLNYYGMLLASIGCIIAVYGCFKVVLGSRRK